MSIILKQSTQIDVRVGPFVDVGDGFTPEIGITLSGADEAELLKADGAATVDISAATWVAVTGCDGWYDLTLTTSHTDTVGELIVIVQDDDVCLPVHQRFQVVEEVIYDALFATSAAAFDANQRIDVGSWLGTAVTLSATTSKPEVDVNSVSDDATAANNLELDYDGTGYNKTNSTIGTAAALTTNNDKTGYSLAADQSGVTVGTVNAATLTGATIDSIWDEPLAAHTTADTPGKVINMLTQDAVTLSTDVALGSIIGQLLDNGTAWSFDRTNDSLEALRDRGDAAWATATTVDLNADQSGVTVGTVNSVAAGGITASSIATDAIDADALAADAIAEINATVDTALSDIGLDHLVSAAVTGPDVTDDSIIAQMVSSAATADWDTFVNTDDALQAIRDRGDAAWVTGAGTGLTALASGTAQAGTSTTIQLAAGETFADDELNGNIVKIHTGTGAGQSRVITDYTGSTDTATVFPNWTTSPDATSQYEVVEGSANLVTMLLDGQSTTDLKDFADAGYDPATDKVQGVVLVDTTTTNTDMVSEPPTAAAVADAVWDEAKAGHVAGGSFGEEVQAHALSSEVSALNDPSSADIADAVWDEVLTGATHNVAQSAGRRLRNIQDFGIYDMASVWVDEVGGTSTGTVSGEDATVTNRANDLDNAQTVAASVGLDRIHVQSGNSITLTATLNGYEVWGGPWTLALGGQDVGTTTFHNATVSGTGTGTTPKFMDCTIGTVTLSPGRYLVCSLTGTFTVGSAGNFQFIDCQSGVAGASAPTVDLGAAVGATTMEFRRWSGGLTLNNVQAGDVVSVDVVSGGTVTVNGTGGTVVIRGTCDVTDNSGGSVTITETSVLNQTDLADSIWDEAKAGHVTAGSFGEEVQAHALSTEISALNDPTAAEIRTEIDSNSTQLAAIVADTNELQTDWADGGRLDVLIDAIKSTTDNLPGSILTTAMTEAYSTQGSTVTVAQALYEILAHLQEFAISGTTKTCKQLDGSTTATTHTLDDATSPTSITRAT